MNDTIAQSTPPNLQPVRLPILKMAAMSVVACVLIGFGGGWLATTRGSVLTDGVWTIGAMLPGILVTLMGLNALPSRPAGLWAVPVLAGTMVRVGIVVVIGFVIYLFASPSKDVFLLTLLMSVLAMLVIDVMMVLSLIKSVEEHSEGRASEMLASEGQA